VLATSDLQEKQAVKIGAVVHRIAATDAAAKTAADITNEIRHLKLRKLFQ